MSPLSDAPPRFNDFLRAGGGTSSASGSSSPTFSDDILICARSPTAASPTPRPCLDAPPSDMLGTAPTFPPSREREETRERVAGLVALTRQGLAILTANDTPNVPDVPS